MSSAIDGRFTAALSNGRLERRIFANLDTEPEVAVIVGETARRFISRGDLQAMWREQFDRLGLVRRNATGVYLDHRVFAVYDDASTASRIWGVKAWRSITSATSSYSTRRTSSILSKADCIARRAAERMDMDGHESIGRNQGNAGETGGFPSLRFPDGVSRSTLSPAAGRNEGAVATSPQVNSTSSPAWRPMRLSRSGAELVQQKPPKQQSCLP